MPEGPQRKTKGRGRSTGSAQLKPERVQAGVFRAAEVDLVFRIADIGTPDELGMVNLELRQPTEVRGLLVGPGGESAAASILIRELRLQVPDPRREREGEAGRGKRRSTRATR